MCYFCVAYMNVIHTMSTFDVSIYLFVHESKVFVTWSTEKTGIKIVVESVILVMA